MKQNIYSSYFINKDSTKNFKKFLSSLNRKRAQKRIFDLVIVFITSPFWFPIFLVLCLCVKISSKGPIFYISKRIGLDGTEFDFYKFRSMSVGAEKLKSMLLDKNESRDGIIFKIKNDPRITSFGRILRKTSLDELPQLLNVIKGDMSLVGPRPPIASEVDQYRLHQYRRLQCVPGITCYWQIYGRSSIPFEEQVSLDLEYMRTSSLITDTKILFLTIPAVLKGEGAY